VYDFAGMVFLDHDIGQDQPVVGQVVPVLFEPDIIIQIGLMGTMCCSRAVRAGFSEFHEIASWGYLNNPWARGWFHY
jgi:hypothetical protein